MLSHHISKGWLFFCPVHTYNIQETVSRCWRMLDNWASNTIGTWGGGECKPIHIWGKRSPFPLYQCVVYYPCISNESSGVTYLSPELDYTLLRSVFAIWQKNVCSLPWLFVQSGLSLEVPLSMSPVCAVPVSPTPVARVDFAIEFYIIYSNKMSKESWKNFLKSICKHSEISKGHFVDSWL